MRYDYILWDFDGTLVDTSDGIFRSLRAAYRESGLPEPDEATLRKFIGPPLMYTFQNRLGFPPGQAGRMTRDFRADYEGGGIYHSRVYEGLEELNRALRARGAKTAVATLKPERMAKLLLSHFGLEDCFDACVGTRGEENDNADKSEIIREILRRLGCRDQSRAVMIGDTRFDALGAKAVGIDFIAAAYGFGITGRQDAGESVFLANSPRELWKFLLDDDCQIGGKVVE